MVSDFLLFWRLSSWSALVLAGVLILFFLFDKKHKFVFKFLLGTVFAALLNESLKNLFAVERDFGFGYAFPSFHAQMIFFLAVFASLEDKRLSWLLLPVALWVSVSRVVLGYHRVEEVFVGALIGVIIAIWFYRVTLKKIFLNELGRQLIHLSGFLLVPIVLLTSNITGGFLCAFIALIAYVGPKTGIKRLVSFFKRSKEKGYSGAVFFFIASGFVLFLFPTAFALAGIIVLSVGDAMSTLFGKHFGRVKIFRSKTLVGALACFVSSYPIILLVVGREVAFPAALVGTFIETFSEFNDNVSIPVGVCLALWLLSHLMLVF
ncbi:phosphatase PAP2 family protein [archaeon]|nr:phosphatase PAP2 family protein [archaeon]